MIYLFGLSLRLYKPWELSFRTVITKRVNELMFRFTPVKRLNRDVAVARWFTLVCLRGLLSGYYLLVCEGGDETLTVLGKAQDC